MPPRQTVAADVGGERAVLGMEGLTHAAGRSTLKRMESRRRSASKFGPRALTVIAETIPGGGGWVSDACDGGASRRKPARMPNDRVQWCQRWVGMGPLTVTEAPTRRRLGVGCGGATAQRKVRLLFKAREN